MTEGNNIIVKGARVNIVKDIDIEIPTGLAACLGTG
jgi:excinuclease UvrABC ATPase subunit